MELNNNSIQQLYKGLNTDYSPINQPKGSYKYALNAVLESYEGDTQQLSNELGNELVSSFKEGYKCIGSVFIDDSEAVLFLYGNNNSEIGIFNSKTNSYRTWCNDETSPEKNKLKFNINYPIQATYKLRRGCEKTIYWTDDYNPQRNVVLNYPQNYQTTINNITFFDSFKFSTQKVFNSIPIVENIEILENSGELPNGSLSILLQYLDQDKNGTKWISEIPFINIYSDNHKDKYSEIDGDINNKDVKEFNNKFSNKAVSVVYNNFDIQYKFFRLAFIHYYSNKKQPTVCYLSDIIPIINGKGSFIYTGNNYKEKATYEEILLFNRTNPFQSSTTIEQKDNRLIVGNIKGDSTNWGELQKYASKIGVDCVIKKVDITKNTDKNNPKNPLVKFFGSSFMPGEIASLAINYVFEDLTVSPSYHIPGRYRYTPKDKIYANKTAEGCILKPMVYRADISDYLGNIDNFLTNRNKSLRYIQRETCNDFDLWGVDIEGNKLLNETVRFHRFPSRKELGLSLVEDKTFTYIFGVQFSNVEIPSESVIGKKCIGYYFSKQELKEDYRTIIDSGYLLDTLQYKQMTGLSSLYSDFSKQYTDRNTGRVDVSQNTKVILSPVNKFIGKTFDNFTHIIETDRFKVIKENKSGFLIQNASELKSEDIEKEIGETKQNDGADLKAVIRDMEIDSIRAYDSSYSKDVKTGGVLIDRQDTRLYYLQPYEKANYRKENVAIYNMDSMSANLFIYVKENAKNSSFGFDRYKSLDPYTLSVPKTKYTNTIPYVYIIRNHNDFFSNYQNEPYYKITDTYSVDKENINISFDGDTYIGGYRHTLSSYCNTAPKQPIKDKSSSLLKAIIVAVLAVALTVLTYGSALAIIGGILVATGGIFYGLRAKLSAEEFNKRFRLEWTNGLRFLFQDNLYWNSFIRPINLDQNTEQLGYQDDTLRYYNQIIGDFIFESPINFTLRVEPNDDDDNYLRPFTEHLPDSANRKIENYNDDKDTFKPYTINNTMVVSRIRLWRSWHMGVPIEYKEENFFLSRLCEVDQNLYKHEYLMNKKYHPAEARNDNNQIAWSMISGYKAYGTAKPIFYCINQDYLIQEKVEKLYAIPFEYSFCSDCREKFPQRFYWSDVSFSEQLTDNYRTFKPNNYKDLPGEYGEITNIFSMYNQLYIHTKNGLWIQPTNYQERVTDGIVSYIGTGEFGSLPAQLIVDSKTGTSAGLNHRNNQIVTSQGYFFVSETDRKVYWFNGQLMSISDIGMTEWFKKNIFHKTTNSGEDVSTYLLNFDYRNDRLILTKRDYKTKFGSTNNDEFTSFWTISFSLKTKTWISFHSYIPNNYLQVSDDFYSILDNKIYKHTLSNSYLNTKEIEKRNYQTFYGTHYPFMIEYISNDNPIVTKIFDHIRFITNAYKFDEINNSFVEDRYKTFNKALIYNSRQCTNIINLKVKDLSPQQEYLLEQIENTNNNTFIVDKTEKDWLLNDIRDMVTNYNVPMFNENIKKLNSLYNINYNDKVINQEAFEGNKEWYDLESLRDKYLVIRLIFDNFADVKLVFNYSSEYNTVSQY